MRRRCRAVEPAHARDRDEGCGSRPFTVDRNDLLIFKDGGEEPALEKLDARLSYRTRRKRDPAFAGKLARSGSLGRIRGGASAIEEERASLPLTAAARGLAPRVVDEACSSAEPAYMAP